VSVSDLVWFPMAVLLGSYVQTVTGFSFGLVVMAVLTVTDTAPVAFSAVVISALALINLGAALRGRYSLIERSIFLQTAAAVVPGVGLGMWLLYWLSQTSMRVLEGILGVVVITGALVAVIRPQRSHEPGGWWTHLGTGAAAGLLSGAYAVSAPPLVFYLYRLKIPFEVAKATIMSLFLVTTSTRTVTAVVAGQFDAMVAGVVLMSAPFVVIGTIAGRRFPPAVSEERLLRVVFFLLVVMGATLCIGSVAGTVS